MAHAQISSPLPSEAELYPSMMNGRSVNIKLNLKANGRRSYTGRIIINGMESRQIGAVLIKGILKGKRNGWPDFLHTKTGPVDSYSSAGNFSGISYVSITTGDTSCLVFLDYKNPEKSWIEV